MTCTVGVNDLRDDLQSCARVGSPGGRYNESNYPVQELGRKRGGGRIFEGGVLAGHYGTAKKL